MELRIRRRRPGESLAALHQDIRRLMALAHPTLSREGREAFACDYFIDDIDMDDMDLALKVRNELRHLWTTHSAYLSSWRHEPRMRVAVATTTSTQPSRRCEVLVKLRVMHNSSTTCLLYTSPSPRDS